MIRQARDLSPAQKAAAELLLGRPLDENESISVQAFEPAPVSEQQRREISAELRRLFDEVDLNLRPTTAAETEELKQCGAAAPAIALTSEDRSGLDDSRQGFDDSGGLARKVLFAILEGGHILRFI